MKFCINIDGCESDYDKLPAITGLVILEDSDGGFWKLVVDQEGNVGTVSDPGPATPIAIVNGGGKHWQIIVDTSGNRGTQASAGPATASIRLTDVNGVVWQVVIDKFGNIGATMLTCGGLSGSGDPTGVIVPLFINQLYHDTVADAYYRSTGLTSADWTAIGGGGGTALTINAAIISNINLGLDSVTTSIDLPNVTTIPNVGGIYLTAYSQLLSVSFAALTSVPAGGIEIDNDAGPNSLLTSISAPLLVTIGSYVLCGGNPSLTTIDWSSWVPSDGTTISFNGSALSAASVELILRRCVLAGVTVCTIDLSGGTNAGLASLSAQGQADAATLGAQLTINP